MNRLYPFTAMIGGALLLTWRVLRRKPQLAPAEEQVDYDGVVVAPTG